MLRRPSCTPQPQSRRLFVWPAPIAVQQNRALTCCPKGPTPCRCSGGKINSPLVGKRKRMSGVQTIKFGFKGHMNHKMFFESESVREIYRSIFRYLLVDCDGTISSPAGDHANFNWFDTNKTCPPKSSQTTGPSQSKPARRPSVSAPAPNSYPQDERESFEAAS